MGKLVIPVESHLQCRAESFDGHNGNGAGRGAYREVNERILAAVLGGDLVYHENREDGNKSAVK